MSYRTKRKNNNAVIVLTGCMPQAFPEVVDAFSASALELLTKSPVIVSIHLPFSFLIYLFFLGACCSPGGDVVTTFSEASVAGDDCGELSGVVSGEFSFGFLPET